MCLGLIWEPDSPKVPIGRSSQGPPTPPGLVNWQHEFVVFSEFAADAEPAEVRGLGGLGDLTGGYLRRSDVRLRRAADTWACCHGQGQIPIRWAL